MKIGRRIEWNKTELGEDFSGLQTKPYLKKETQIGLN
jgi:hypothetical protein